MTTDASVEAYTRDWRRLRHQKHRKQGGVEAAYLLDFLLWEGEHQSVQVQNTILTRAFRHERDKNKLRLVVNLAKRLAERKIGRLWSIDHKFRATPNTKDPLAFDKADVISDSVIPFTDFKLGQNTLRWEIYSWMVKCGVCFEHVDYKEAVSVDVMPKWNETGDEVLWKDTLSGAEISESELKTLLSAGAVLPERFEPATEVQTQGDLGGDIYDPFRVFVDASVRQVKFLGPDQAIYLADIRSFGWMSNTFGSDVLKKLKSPKDLSILSTSLLDQGMPVNGLNLKDLLPLVQGSRDKDDPEMAIVLTRYQPRSEENPEGRRCFFVPDQAFLDEGVNPYPEVPIVDYHWSVPKATMWTTGFMRDLQSPQKFINKRFSQLGEAANSQLYSLGLLGGNLKAGDIPTDMPGWVEGGLDDNGNPLVREMTRGQLPAFFPETIKLSMETLDAIGSSDLMSQRKFPGQIRGSLAIPMIQELLDSEDGPRFSHLAEQFSLEKQMRINRIKQFYEPIRTLNYTGADGRAEVLEFHAEEVMRAGVDFTVTIDPGTILPEMSSMREARVRERMQWAPFLYTNPRTGQIDPSKVAKDLKYNDTQRDGDESQCRKLARQLTRWVQQGKLTIKDTVDPQTGQPKPMLIMEDGRPFMALPFWNHNAMMDEYEAKMTETEFLTASPQFQRTLQVLHSLHRNILAASDEARMQSVQNQMMQGAVAQATQQSAAMAASVAAKAAIDEVMSSQEEANNSGVFGNMQAQLRELLGGAMAHEPAPNGPPALGPTGRKVLPL